MESGATNIEDMVMDLVPDDSKAIFKKRCAGNVSTILNIIFRSMMHWDKKSKKYVEIKGGPASKLIRNER